MRPLERDPTRQCLANEAARVAKGSTVPAGAVGTEVAAAPLPQRAAQRTANPAINQPTTEPSLKIGRYMPTTMPPTTTPMKTMIIGSSRLERASTALFTSVS